MPCTVPCLCMCCALRRWIWGPIPLRRTPQSAVRRGHQQTTDEEEARQEALGLVRIVHGTQGSGGARMQRYSTESCRCGTEVSQTVQRYEARQLRVEVKVKLHRIGAGFV